MDIINEIIKEEWEQFQNVHNEGGRASCQDDWEQFRRMRKSQFLNWPDALLVSYYGDLLLARQEGRNLLFEKYAFMMRDTAPRQFQELEPYLPQQSEKKLASVRECVKIHVKWAEECYQKYPKTAVSGRAIHKQDACCGGTSIETYTEGELLSYSEETILLYEAFLQECLAAKRNLAIEDRENIAQLYGYKNIQEMEDERR